MTESNLKAVLRELDFVYTTDDMWTANNISFQGVIVHWISSCRIGGRHKLDVIGAEIQQIHSSYGLLGKVVATVTDYQLPSNFVNGIQDISSVNLEPDSELGE